MDDDISIEKLKILAKAKGTDVRTEGIRHALYVAVGKLPQNCTKKELRDLFEWSLRAWCILDE